MFRAFLVLSLGFAAAGCGSLFAEKGGYTALNDVRCAVDAERVGPLKFVTAPPAEPHEEKGMIEAIVPGAGASATRDAIAELRSEGARHGCHLLRLNGTAVNPRDPYVRYSDDLVADLLTNAIVNDVDRKVVTASCLVFVSPTCDPAETEPPRAPRPPPEPAPPEKLRPPPPPPSKGFIDAAPAA